MKRPAFQFYPGDWQRDAALRACSIGARGLWLEMICVMHQANPYGFLALNGQGIEPETLARMVGASTRETKNWLAELEKNGVFSREDSVIVSRRMIRDEEIRKSRAEGGKLGGNPALKDKQEVGEKDNLRPNLRPTPSSSTSSSTSSSNHNPANAGFAKPAVPPCPYLQIIDLYHKHLPTARQVNPELWSGTRAKHLQTRWREKPARQNLEWWDRWFAFIAESDFLTGKTPPAAGRKPFTLSLDWIVNPTNFAKIHEGAYSNG